ncbi:unnamed protein product [Closterium sp. NIES-53]
MGGCTVRKGGAVVMEAKLEKGLCLLLVCVPQMESPHGVEAEEAACSTHWRNVEQVSADLLHLRMGQAGRQQLVECVKEELKGVKIKEGGGQPSKCPDCTTGELPRTSFPTSTTRVSAPLESVHSDVCGPMQTPDREKCSKYFITFLDDYSCLSWVTLVRTKDEVANVFKHWICYAEREAGANVKIHRSDRDQRVVESQDVAFHEGLSYKGWKEHGASTTGSSLEDPNNSSIFEGAWEDPGEEVEELQEKQMAAAPHHEESPTAGSTPDPNAPAHDPQQPQGL